MIVNLKKLLCKYKFALLGMAVYFTVTQLAFGQTCLSKVIFGLPCPGCGLTRAGFSFFTGHFSESFHMNPMFPVFFLFAAAAVALHFAAPKHMGKLKIAAVPIIAATIAVFILRMILYFPGGEPMNVFHGSIFHRILDLFKFLTK